MHPSSHQGAAAGAAARSTDLSTADVRRVTELVREHFDMDVAFVGRFADRQRWFRYVAGGGEQTAPVEGCGDPMDESYCKLVADATLEAITPDTLEHPTLCTMPVTGELGIRAYLAVPIRFSSGEVYGTLCCYSHEPRHDLTERDAATLQLVANLMAVQLEDEQSVLLERRSLQQRIGDVLESRDLHRIVYQPIADLASGRVVGFEALSRFDYEPARTPDVWFSDAERVGLGGELQANVLRRVAEDLPSGVDAYVSVNVSAKALTSQPVQSALAEVPAERLVIELTEHEADEDHDGLAASLRALRERGFKVAMDDVGAGYAGLERVLRIAPDIVKLDRSIVNRIDADVAQQAMVAATVHFAGSVGATIVAEGIETAAACQRLRDLKVGQGQGYWLGEPAPYPWRNMDTVAPVAAVLTGRA